MHATVVNRWLNIYLEVYMKYLIGITAALLLLVLVLLWQLRSASGEIARARQEAAQAVQTATEQRAEAELLMGRFAALDKTLTGLAHVTQANADQLTLALDGIETITKTEGDSDEAVNCLDVRVPAQLADRVR